MFICGRKSFTSMLTHFKYAYLNLCFVSGCSPEGPCPDSHWGEAVPLPHLWNPFPPPANPEEPSAHSYGREALHCESQVSDTENSNHGSHRVAARLTRWPFVYSVREVRPSLPPQEPAASAPAPETRGRDQHQDPLQGPHRALPAYSTGLLKGSEKGLRNPNQQGILSDSV